MTKAKSKRMPSHLHLLKRIDITRNPKKKPYIVYACQHGGCSYYISVKLAVGKLAKCWICGDPFILDKVSATHAKPHCNECIKRKVKPEIELLGDLIKDI